MSDDKKCSDCDHHPRYIYTDTYGLGKMVADTAFWVFCAFFMLFCGQCTGCVDVLSRF